MIGAVDFSTDVRFTVPLYTVAEAARALSVPEATFRSWAQGYVRRRPDRPPVTGDPIVTSVPPPRRGDPSIPFIGLAEAAFLRALRSAEVPLQQIRPALALVERRLGVDHALASRRLYLAGAQLLWEVSEDREVDPDAQHGARDLIVLRDDQYVFREVVERYLRRIDYGPDDYATRLVLPQYEVAEVRVDPQVNFGRPYFAASGVPIDAVLSRLRAGEGTAELSGDFGVPEDQIVEVSHRAARSAA